MSKDLQTHALVSLPLKTILFDVPAQKSCKEKTLRKSEKTNHAQVSHSFKNSFTLKNMQKKLAETKLYT